MLADICRDLCIQPGDIDAARWRDLVDAVVTYGGSLVTLSFRSPLTEMVKQRARRLIAGVPPGEWVVPPLPVAAAGRPTGPPDGAGQHIAT